MSVKFWAWATGKSISEITSAESRAQQAACVSIRKAPAFLRGRIINRGQT